MTRQCKLQTYSRIAACLALFAQGALAQAPTMSPAPADPPAAKTQHTDALRLLDYWLDYHVAVDRIPTFSSGVVIGKDLVYKRGFGHVDPAKTIAASATTLYSICSISKLFTSIAAMQLREVGKLSLDDDITKLVPTLRLQSAGPDAAPITVYNLLTHTGGLARETAIPSWPPETSNAPSREDILQRLATQAPFSAPSDRRLYGNLAMTVLGEVVSQVSGEAYAKRVEEQILRPLGMLDTRLSIAPELFNTRLPQGFSVLKRDGSREVQAPYNSNGYAPAAGYYSTVADLARFASWQFRLRKQGGQEVLKVASLRDMHRAQWTEPDGSASFGLGFRMQSEGNKTVVGHTGSCPGYESGISLVLDDEVAVIGMSNAIAAGPYTNAMRQLVLKGLRLPIAPTGGELPNLEDYAGRYSEMPWIEESVVVPWGRDLVGLDFPSTNPADSLELLRHIQGDTFKWVRKDGTLSVELTFERDAKGKVTGYRQWNYFVKKL